jgi:hypothetical protein
LRVLRRQSFPEECERDLLAILEAGRPGPLTLLYEAGYEAGLDRDRLLARTAAIYIGFCAGNLADDLADGDVDYLAEPLRQAPGAQYLLHSLSFAELAASGLPSAAIECGARTLARSSSLQQIEVRTRVWTAARYLEVGESIAGLQWQAYLYLLWHGTPLEARAQEVGTAGGFVGFVISDLSARDPRLLSLTTDDRALVTSAMNAVMEKLRQHPLTCVDMLLRGGQAALEP